MSYLQTLSIECGDAAFSMLSGDPVFKPEHLYQHKQNGQDIHICTWENAPIPDEEYKWIRSVLLQLDEHEDPDDVTYGYKMFSIGEGFNDYTAEFNPAGFGFDTCLKVVVDIPFGADIIL